MLQSRGLRRKYKCFSLLTLVAQHGRLLRGPKQGLTGPLLGPM